ncbi:tRNA 2-selenouridine synthase [Planctomycetes bacterium Poly30]|uniref:tRNA 2-selenouridine synthase n=2 Tax=Saltatorellus ferox TaxID=2528018 RepID=A0A518EKY8_9BACT|nr:tRNA 2-selenouridine synthase [Planctomycetes bacterium Poly30]
MGRPGAVVIDLRAPSEFAVDHLPGAVNVPLFEDQTRSFVGLLYKQFSPEAAFQEGRDG